MHSQGVAAMVEAIEVGSCTCTLCLHQGSYIAPEHFFADIIGGGVLCQVIHLAQIPPVVEVAVVAGVGATACQGNEE